jgi:hypothetical protein
MSKEPAIHGGFHQATTDPDIIRGWWLHQPKFNIGLATGTPPKIFVVDIDGDNGEAALRALEAEQGAIPATIEVITARGRHLYFRMPSAPIANSAGRVAAGIDVRGTGGYVLAPPSIHPSGRAYAWSVDCAAAFADAPQWLIDRAASQSSNGAGNGASPLEWRDLVAGGADEGTRDNTVARLAGYLFNRHVDPFVALGLLQSWNATSCRPPLPDKDIERICRSVAKKELRKRNAQGD